MMSEMINKDGAGTDALPRVLVVEDDGSTGGVEKP